MASVHRRPASQYWHAAFRGTDGRLSLVSTKCKDRSKALAAAFEFERAAKLAGAGNLVEAQARKIVADIMERAGGEETLRAPTVKAFFDSWLAGKKTRKAVSTNARYDGAVQNFYAVLGERVNKPLTSLTTHDVERFMAARTDEKLSSSTVVLSVKVIHGVERGAAARHHPDESGGSR